MRLVSVASLLCPARLLLPHSFQQKLRLVLSAKYSTQEQGSPRKSWQPLGIQKPSYWHTFFVNDLSLVFIWTLYHVKQKKKSMYYNSEAFFSSAAYCKIIQLIHYTVML